MGGKDGVLSALYSLSWLEWGCWEQIGTPTAQVCIYFSKHSVLQERTIPGVASGKAEDEETVSNPFKCCSSSSDLLLLAQHLQPVSLTRGWVRL